MARALVAGLIAGAAGTVALNVATYGDMLLRGRGASNVPAEMADRLTRALGLPLKHGDDDQQGQHREEGLGALFGYATGLGVGLLYGLVEPALADAPLPLRGAGLGLAAMAGSDVPIAVSGVSDPRTWGLSGWLSDLVPHLIYGLVTALVFDAVASPD